MCVIYILAEFNGKNTEGEVCDLLSGFVSALQSFLSQSLLTLIVGDSIKYFLKNILIWTYVNKVAFLSCISLFFLISVLHQVCCI